MDNPDTTSTVLTTQHSGLLRQRVADLILWEAQALVFETLAECLVEVDSALSECLPLQQEPEPHLPNRQALPALRLRDKIAADRQVAVRRRIEAERRQPRTQLLSEPVIRPAWEGEDTLLKERR